MAGRSDKQSSHEGHSGGGHERKQPALGQRAVEMRDVCEHGVGTGEFEGTRVVGAREHAGDEAGTGAAP